MWPDRISIHTVVKDENAGKQTVKGDSQCGTKRTLRNWRGDNGIEMLLAFPDQGETWLAVFDGKAWRPAVQVTNYKAQSSTNYKATGTRSSVTTVGSWAAGFTAAATIDPQGHLLLVHEADQFGNFAIQGGSVTGVGGGTVSPKLLFHKF